MSFAEGTGFFSMNVETGEVSVANLIGGTGREDDYIVVVIGVGLLLLKVFLSFFGNYIQSQFLVVVVSDPRVCFYLRLNFLHELLCLL